VGSDRVFITLDLELDGAKTGASSAPKLSGLSGRSKLNQRHYHYQW